MRQTTGNTFIFELVLTFTLLFTAFLALAITYNKAFRIKNEVTSVIEKYEGANDGALGVINNYLSSSGYRTKGKCPKGYSGIDDYTSTSPKVASGSEEYYYCFLSNDSVKSSNSKRKYYTVIVFYKFNLPVLGELATFKVTGETKTIFNGGK